MKELMKEYACYGKFNKYADGGYHITAVSKANDDWYHEDDEYFFIAYISLPEVDKELIMQSGIKTIDKEIADLLLKVEAKKHEKQSLMALEHKA